ncbi:MAG: UDP-N-acetylmuramate--L-alanine ligase [Deltaproteobacteria bacterium]|nr:UDP-N-acetylmuramate--L-alanine ligase [Deltaproteobacteria bacterium]
MYNKINKIHLIGIGGIGMSGIAEILSRNGYSVSGSDIHRSDTVKHLEAQGIEVFIGHESKNVEHAELVVYSSAIKEDNPEFAAALQKDLPTIPRAEMLAELMRIKYGIAVAGAHGKTTTTSMVAIILTEAGLDPTVVVGGRMDNFGGTNARLGNGEFMVVEADESDGSFNKLSPSIAVITNIDREHMDHYGTVGKLKSAFLSFMNKTPFYGLTVLCGDDPYLRILQHKTHRRKQTFGFHKDNSYHVTDYQVEAQITRCRFRSQGTTETIQLNVPGRHNVLNALAAIIVADELSVPRSVSIKALSKYQGVQRRFQLRGDKQGVLFVDDYAHHPTEIRMTLKAAFERYPSSRIRVIFQPHRYSRVEDLLEQFATCFKGCHGIAITDIYAAGETKVAGIDSSLLVEAIQRQGEENVIYAESPMKAIERWLSDSKPGDVVLTMGAGDLPNVYKQLF